MKLATFQPIERCENHKNTEHYNAIEEQLGFYPIFCISAENYNDLRIQSILAAPWCPQVIYFFETNDYHVLNIAEYNINRTVLLDDAAGDDYRCLEYIVEKIPETAVCYDIYDTMEHLCHFGIDGSSEAKLVRSLSINSMKRIRDSIACDSYYETHTAPERFYSPDEHHQSYLQLLKICYLDFGLYFDYNKWIGNPLSHVEDIRQVCFISMIYSDALGRMLVAEYNDKQCTPGMTACQSHVLLYDKISKYILANSSFVLINCKKLSPNDRCACGSGKKFKKCCKPYIVRMMNLC